ncbi:MAG: hypothetical protein C0621_00545 [Desulfuromonas sp.]|nr:MAG: hypothetical protein C0621_00545 [Desulfuromonas sp.]
MLRYCAWCESYLGATPAPGYQIRADLCEIDTTSICPSCYDRVRHELSPSGEMAAPKTKP